MYYKSHIKEIYNEKGFSEVIVSGELPEDTSDIFFILKKKATRAVYFDSFGKGIDTYRLLFATLKDFNISTDILSKGQRTFISTVEWYYEEDVAICFGRCIFTEWIRFGC